MCITFLFVNRSDPSLKYKLILINNRDEIYSRKTLNANLFKSDIDDLIQIYGTDVETKVVGTWLAISKHKDVVRIGNLLNVPGEVVIGRKEDLKPRGPIALDFVTTTNTIEVHNKRLCEVCTSYNSFNLLSVEITLSDIKTYFISNSTHKYEELFNDIIGASNSPINIPLQKVVEGKKKFHKIIQESRDKSKDELIDELMSLLKCKERHFPDSELSKRCGQNAELFSSIHVRLNELYGTRTRTIILIDDLNNIDYIEETMINADAENPKWESTKFSIKNDYSFIQH